MKGKFKYIFWTLLPVSFLLCSLFIASLISILPKSEEETPIDDTYYIKKPVVSQENSEASKLILEKEESSPLPLYTVKEFEGVIGIYNYGESTPFQKENLKIKSLPEKDREILKEGRSFYSYKELMEFLMDYE